MKRNKFSTKVMRRAKTVQYQPKALAGTGNSRYARKVKSGNQMYGPGCCAHRR